jgi:DNA-binding transcriptional LysR family regulator
MSFENLDLNLLKVFDAVYRERNITRAAELLHMSQPTASNSLQRLRDALGDPLFIRERRGVSSTTFADNIAPDIQNALYLVRQSVNSIKDFDPSTSRRTFKVSMNDPIEALFLPGLMLEIASSAPNINIRSSYVGRHELANEMSMGNLDIGLDVFVPNDDRLNKKELLSENYVCLVRREHPLVGKPLSIDDYLAMSHLHVSARRHGLGYIDRILQEAGQEREIRLRTRSMELAANTVRHTDFGMTVPDHFARHFDLQALQLPFNVPNLPWQLYWSRHADYDAGCCWLRDVIRNIAASYQSHSIADIRQLT